MRKLLWAASGVSAMALLMGMQPVAASAQTAPVADPASVGEIVVTTRRSGENVQKIPLAIAVTSAQQLQDRGITDLQGVAQYTPSLSFKDYVTSFHGNATIRGMTAINTTDPVTNVGIFVDGVNLQRDYQANLSLGDFERIEVVKGPQSALYGANTFAGAINYVTKAPTDDYHANGEATVGNAGAKRLQAGLGGPIIKGLLDARIYVGKDVYDGTYKNNLPGITGTNAYFDNHDRSAESIALKFTPTDRLTLDMYYGYNQGSSGIRPFYTVSGKFTEDVTNCGTVNTTTLRPQLLCGQFPTNPAVFRSGIGSPPSGLYSASQPPALNTNKLLKVGGKWDIGHGFALNYIYGNTDGTASEDYAFFSNTYNPSPQYRLNANGTQSAVFVPFSYSQQIEGGKIGTSSHEVRLSYDEGKPYKFEFGYSHSDSDDRYFLGIQSIAVTAAGGIKPALTRVSNDALYSPPGTIFLNNLDERFKVDSGFARAAYTFLNDKATVTAEFRYTHTDLKFTDINYTLKNPTAAPLTSAYNDPIPRFTAEYRLTPDNLFYASAAEGIKTGGFNGYASGTLTLLPGEQSYAEEKNWTYEFGSKNSFMDRTLFLNVDVFYIDWFQKQASQAPSNLPPNTGSGLTTVASIYKSTGAATNYGIELDGQYRPIRPLTINFAFTAQNPKYNSGAKNTAFIGYCTVGTCPIDGSIGGNTIERQSQLSGSIASEYRDHFVKEWDYFVGADVTYQSMQFADQENLSSIAPITLMNGRLGVENGNLRFFLWGKNLFDTTYVDNAFYVQGQQQYTAAFGERRTFGATVAAKF